MTPPRRASGVSLVLAGLSLLFVVVTLVVGTGSRSPPGLDANPAQVEAARDQPIRLWTVRATAALSAIAAVIGAVVAASVLVRRRGTAAVITGFVINLALIAVYVCIVWIGAHG